MAATSESIMAMEKSSQLKTFRTDVGEDNDTENNTENQKCGNKGCFYFTALIVNEILLITVVLLGCGWLSNFVNGVAWSNNYSQRINLHGVFMFIGSIFAAGQAIMAYRICARRNAKIIHAVLMITSCVFIIIGTYLAYSADVNSLREELEHFVKLKRPLVTRHFISVHSWLGICVCVLSIIQLVVGFVSFIVLDLLKSGAMCRVALLPIHASFGIIIYTVGIATGLTGLNTYVFFFTFPTMSKKEFPVIDGFSRGWFMTVGSLGVLMTLLIPFMPICLYLCPRNGSRLTLQGAHRPGKNKT